MSSIELEFICIKEFPSNLRARHYVTLRIKYFILKLTEKREFLYLLLLGNRLDNI